MTSSERAIVTDQLNHLLLQSEYLQDGWSLLKYGVNDAHPIEPLFRSEISALDDAENYWSTVSMLVDEGEGFVGLGHLRATTSGMGNIPNPHPWMFYDGNVTYSFIHNGTVNKALLYDLITNDGTDESWLYEHEPQTFGGGAWDDEGWSKVVDSDLILLFVMQQIQESGQVLTGLQTALNQIIEEGVSAHQLNIVFSNGSSLFVFGGRNGLFVAESSEHYSVMTQRPSDGAAAAMNWTGIQSGELVLINDEGLSYSPNFEDNDPDPPVPSTSHLFSPFPNPFNGAIRIPYRLDLDQNPTLSIYSLNGNPIYDSVLSNEDMTREYYNWVPNTAMGKTIASGIYIIQLRTDEWLDSKKILFIK